MKVKIDKYDKLWSKLVRERDGKCRVCGRRPPWKLEAHHVMPRGRSMTRYDLSNGITLCFLHHTGPDSVHRSPLGSKKFCIRIIGAREYARLERKSLAYMSREKAKKTFLESIK